MKSKVVARNIFMTLTIKSIKTDNIFLSWTGSGVFEMPLR